MKDFYSILGVDPAADAASIKTAYRQLAKENHPDLKPNDQVAEARFKEINEAYETLKDPTKRSQYDAQRLSPHSRANWSNRPEASYQSWNFTGDVDIDSIIRDLHGARANRGFYSDVKNRDIILNYSITLEEAFHGKEADIRYNISGHPTQEFKFKIPIGVHDGVRLRFQGRGDTSVAGVAPGDLYIRINIIPHSSFIRMNYNLHTSITIDYLDAILGCDREIQTIEGSKIKMRVPAGISPGQHLRAQGKGMPLSNGTRGDLMIEIVIKSKPLSEEQRKLIEEARNLRT